jgi:hypothetical protein
VPGRSGAARTPGALPLRHRRLDAQPGRLSTGFRQVAAARVSSSLAAVCAAAASTAPACGR